ncbi:MAG: asparaginase [Thermonemataceae bacterium]
MKKIIIDTASPQPPKANVLMIYTGGTLGMVYDNVKGLVPFDFELIEQKIPELRKLQLEITVISIEPLIDSANIQPNHWIELATIVRDNYEQYDGFVILHGTDTMAYSASALSFLLQNLGKPIVFTGAQLPIGEPRNDARVNLITSLEVASSKNDYGHPAVPEVCILFDYFLWRGNRTKKVESEYFDAFNSQNYPHLAEVGIDIQYNYKFIKPLPVDLPLAPYTNLATEVGVVKVFPGLQPKWLEKTLLDATMRAVVLETYGSGTAPTAPWFLKVVEKAILQGMIVLNVSQCFGGMVMQGLYETSRYLNDIGVVSGKDITVEAALAKLMFLLAKEEDKENIIKQLRIPLCGEMS